MDTLANRLQQIFRDVFDEPEMRLNDSMTAADVLGWDSLAHVNLIIAIERELGIRFATSEISRMKEPGQNVGSFIQLIETKIDASHK